MGYFESCFIPPAVYERDIENRLYVSKGVEVGRVLNLMVSLDGNRAIKTPIAFKTELGEDEASGLLVACASFLNVDLNPEFEYPLAFDERSLFVPQNGISFNRYRALGGYVVSYGDGLGRSFEFPPEAIVALGPQQYA